MLQALIAYRFLTGIGIGAEYPSGSVAASENTEDPGVPKKMQHFLFAMATNVAIDWGFVIAALVPLIMVAICGEGRLDIAWRLSFAIGIIPPLLVLYWRLRMTEPLAYQKGAMKNAPTPYWLITKRYWKPMLGISLSWFIYDWISYPFGIYSSTILDAVIPGDAPLTTVFGWNVVINLFYIPGCMIGSLFLDRFNPKIMMISMLLVQAGVGFLSESSLPSPPCSSWHIREPWDELGTRIGAFVDIALPQCPDSTPSSVTTSELSLSSTDSSSRKPLIPCPRSPN
jgi:MFS family permease